MFLVFVGLSFLGSAYDIAIEQSASFVMMSLESQFTWFKCIDYFERASGYPIMNNMLISFIFMLYSNSVIYIYFDYKDNCSFIQLFFDHPSIFSQFIDLTKISHQFIELYIMNNNDNFLRCYG